MGKRTISLSVIAAAMVLFGFECVPQPPPEPPPLDVPPATSADSAQILDLVTSPPGPIVYIHPMGGVGCPDVLPPITIMSPNGSFDSWQLNDAPPWVNWPDSGPVGEVIYPEFNCQVPGLGEYAGEINLIGFMADDKENSLSDSLIIKIEARVVTPGE